MSELKAKSSFPEVTTSVRSTFSRAHEPQPIVTGTQKPLRSVPMSYMPQAARILTLAL